MADDIELCPILAVLRTTGGAADPAEAPQEDDQPLDACREDRCAWWHPSKRCAILVIARRLGSRS